MRCYLGGGAIKVEKKIEKYIFSSFTIKGSRFTTIRQIWQNHLKKKEKKKRCELKRKANPKPRNTSFSEKLDLEPEPLKLIKLGTESLNLTNFGAEPNLNLQRFEAETQIQILKLDFLWSRTRIRTLNFVIV